MDFNWRSYTDEILISMAFALGLILRLSIIGEYGFSEDEILKVNAVRGYMSFDFTGNIQHPALCKLLITLSTSILGESEFSLRLPNAIIGALTVFPIYYLGRELLNSTTGLIASFLWSVDIVSIAFTTTAKEDALLTFFCISAIYFFIRLQENESFLVPTGISIGLAFASKYTSILLVLYLGMLLIYKSEEYSYLFHRKLFLISIIAGVVFSLANFPVFLEHSLQDLLDYYLASNRPFPSRTGFIMSGHLYDNRPVWYLLQFLLYKVPMTIIVFSVIGFLIMFNQAREQALILLGWIIFILVIFSFGYGYTRYLLIVLPMILIFTAYGVTSFALYLVSFFSKYAHTKHIIPRPQYVTTGIFVGICIYTVITGLVISPYYRMYVNEIGGGQEYAGTYFPQDSVYDYYMREAIEYVNIHADYNTTVSLDVAILGDYYGREDINFVYTVSQPKDIVSWDSSISYVIIQQSRIYFENQKQIEQIRASHQPEITYTILQNTVVEIYFLG